MLNKYTTYQNTTTFSIFCPQCHKIMEPAGRMPFPPDLICRDCDIRIKPKFFDMKKVRARCEVRTVEIKAIDMAYDLQHTVKFSTVDYFQQLIRVEFSGEKFIVERKDLKRMLEDLQLTQE